MTRKTIYLTGGILIIVFLSAFLRWLVQPYLPDTLHEKLDRIEACVCKEAP
jgi:hypothetical protein